MLYGGQIGRARVLAETNSNTPVKRDIMQQFGPGEITKIFQLYTSSSFHSVWRGT
jgi:hypothetical protein